MASAGTVPNIDSWGTKPALNFLYGDWDILCVGPVKAPQFSTCSGFGNTMAIIIEQDSIILGLLAQCLTKTTKIFEGGIQDGFVSNLEGKSFELVLKIRSYGF